MTIPFEAVEFDRADCTLREESPVARTWMSPEGLAVRLAVGDRFEWPFDLTDSAAAHAFYDHQCTDKGGAMLNLEVGAAAGAESLRGIFKYRAPVPKSLAMYYVGILWIPFDTAHIQINVEGMERGTTGTRGAMAFLLHPEKFPKPSPEQPPIKVNTPQEMFDRMRATPIRKAPSDDPEYDAMLPKDALSQVRARLNRVVETLRIVGAPLEPFRVRRR